VTRLREAQKRGDLSIADQDLFADGADEIERLRADHRRVGDLYERERTRAERAEAENVALQKKLDGLEQYRARDQLAQRVLNAEAERDALRARITELDPVALILERAERAEAERDALRREADEQRKFADTFQAYNDKHLRERNYYRDERDALYKQAAQYAMACGTATQDIAALRAERDALRRDAERYRWLRAQPTFFGWEHDYPPHKVDSEVDEHMQRAALRKVK
jgi:hypothetical protein